MSCIKNMSESKRGGRWIWCRTLFLSSLLLNLLFLNQAAWAEDEGQDDDPPAAEEAPSDAANKDLLLFWEEKELYVETATRTAKPISQVAENMEVITAKDIEDMNAHSVNEVLNRVPGLFVDFGSNDFNSPAQLHIQGGESRHVTVLLDGVVWNFLSDGHAETVSIPVGIIDRIEIIKGPASSTWGSALSGVINIITKAAGDSTIPKGMASASYGQANSRDLNAQLFGKAGMVGYFLHAGRLASDGLANDRHSQSDSLYAKLALTPIHNLDATFTVGYSNPEVGEGALHTGSPFGVIDATGKARIEAFHATSALEYRFSPELSLKAELNTLRINFVDGTTFTTPNPLLQVQAGDILRRSRTNDHTVSGSLKLGYSGGIHAAVMGIEGSHGRDVMEVEMPWRSISTRVAPEVHKWGIFANDTLTLGNFAVTPGIRFDHDSVAGQFVSPSLGTTYQFSEHSIVRASVAKGFTRPPFAATSGGGALWQASPDLTAEQGWSYQAGLESAVMDRINLKGTIFRHDIDNAISDGPDPTQGKYINVGKIVRQGYEVSAESAPLYNTSLKVSNSFVHVDPDAPFRATSNYSYQVALKYDDRKSWLAQLAGTYVSWDLPAGTANDEVFVWDGNVNRRFRLASERSVEVFFTVHNIFGAHYTTSLTQPNPGRWLEGGVKCRF